MLKKLHIRNYKSINDLELELGQINVFIGENGCGKSNILEALALAAAATANKLDNQFLESRGVRMTSPELMRANFDSSNQDKPILIDMKFSNIDGLYSCTLNNNNKAYSKWKWEASLKSSIGNTQLSFKDIEKDILEKLNKTENKREKEAFENLIKNMVYYENKPQEIQDYLIFSPENTALRRFYEEGQVEPLGINGTGLLKLLKVMTETEKEQLLEIKERLELFGWYESLSIPTMLCEQEDKIQIKDKYIKTFFDQRSVNEGFLFILFYIALIVSKNTPTIFAIDNIDASLNPALCTKIIKEIIQLGKKYNKQILLTTHNPAILDGLNLTDQNQKLFVCSRNKKGHTRIKQLTAENKPKSATNEPLKLSEAMLRGYLGGLPKGF